MAARRKLGVVMGQKGEVMESLHGDEGRMVQI